MDRLQPGDPAPRWKGVDQDGREVSSEALGKAVVYFYPAAFTPGCTTEACDFRDRHERFAAAGYTVVGISPDPPDKLARFRAEHGLPFDLIADADHAIADAFGAWGTKVNYGREYQGLIRSTFVIAEDGTVEHAWYNVRAKGHGERVAGSLAP